jgi:transposase-like protein
VKRKQRNKLEPKAGRGRPTIATPELKAEICRLVSEGHTVRQICRRKGMPDQSTLWHWRRSDESFSQTLTRAREEQAETWADQMIEIADGELATHEAIGKARLQLHARDRLIGAYNARYRQDKGSVNVQVGVAVTLPEAERVRLIQRWEQAQRALADGQGLNQEPV